MRRKLTSCVLCFCLLAALIVPVKANASAELDGISPIIVVCAGIGGSVGGPVGTAASVVIAGAILGSYYAATHWSSVKNAAHVALSTVGEFFKWVGEGIGGFFSNGDSRKHDEPLRKQREDESRRANTFVDAEQKTEAQGRAIVDRMNEFVGRDHPHVSLNDTNHQAEQEAARFAQGRPVYGGASSSPTNFRTPTSSPQYAKLQATDTYRLSAASYVANGNVTHAQERNSLLSIADVGIKAADASAASGEMDASDGLLSSVNSLIDTVFSYENVINQVSRGSTFTAGVLNGAFGLPSNPLRGYEGAYGLGKATGAALRMVGDVALISGAPAVAASMGGMALASGGVLTAAAVASAAEASVLVTAGAADLTINAQVFKDGIKEWKDSQSHMSSAAGGADGGGVPSVVARNPFGIRFSQDSVKAGFRNGGTIDELVAGLKNGTIKPGDVPAIRLVEREGNLITIDNRRLQAFREAGMDIPTRMATPEEILHAEKIGKFSAGDLGADTIRIRGR